VRIFLNGTHIAEVPNSIILSDESEKEEIMKRLLLIIALSITLVGVASAKHHPFQSASFGVFYSSLSPHGEWIDCNIGYVWRPLHIVRGWRPYLMGRWIWTSYGWYWASDEPFGWATFHYGRWHYDDYYGWIWIPDDMWGPAWVEWRYDNDYIGWAPLPPGAVFDLNIGIRFTHGWVSPHYYWNFVPYHRFTSERVIEYVQPTDRNPRIFGNTRGLVNIRSTNDRIINPGVDVRAIEQRGNVRINTVEVVERSRGDRDRLTRDGNNERLEIYRPRLEGRMREDVVRPAEVRRADKPIMLDGMHGPRSGRRESARPNPPDRHDGIAPPERRRDPTQRDPMRRDRVPPPERRIDKPQPGMNRGVQRPDNTKEMRRPPVERFNREPMRAPERGVDRHQPEQRREGARPAIEGRDGRTRDRGQGESQTRQRRPQ